jgi:hypothetical protein
VAFCLAWGGLLVLLVALASAAWAGEWGKPVPGELGRLMAEASSWLARVGLLGDIPAKGGGSAYEPLYPLAVFLAVIGAVLAVGNWLGFRTCRWCGRLRIPQHLGSTVADRRRCYGLVTRHARTSLWGGYSGRRSPFSHPDSPTYESGSIYSSGTTTWKERVPVIRTTHLHHYRCRSCGHKWDEEEVVQKEDFDSPRP